MKPSRFLLAAGAVFLVLGLALPSFAANKAPSPKSGKTVNNTGSTGTPSSGGSGSSTQKVPPHNDQGPLTLPPY